MRIKVRCDNTAEHAWCGDKDAPDVHIKHDAMSNAVAKVYVRPFAIAVID